MPQIITVSTPSRKRDRLVIWSCYPQSFDNDLFYLCSHPFEGVPIQSSCHYHQLESVARGLAVKHGHPETNSITCFHLLFRIHFSCYFAFEQVSSSDLLRWLHSEIPIIPSTHLYLFLPYSILSILLMHQTSLIFQRD